jgi:hypothetical protein
MSRPQINTPIEQKLWDYMVSRPAFCQAELKGATEASEWKSINFLRKLQRQGHTRECGRLSGTLYFTTLADPNEALNRLQLETEFDRQRSAGQRLGAALERLSEVEDTPAEPSRWTPTSKEEKALWNFMFERRRFTRADLLSSGLTSEAEASRLFRQLRQARVIREAGRISGQRLYSVHSPADSQGIHRDKRRTLEGMIWNAIRTTSNGFSPIEIYGAIGDVDGGLTLRKIQDYCKTLYKAGYLKGRGPKRQTGQPVRYRLVRDTGPLPPQERRTPVVIDQNEDRIVYAPGGLL